VKVSADPDALIEKVKIRPAVKAGPRLHNKREDNMYKFDNSRAANAAQAVVKHVGPRTARRPKLFRAETPYSTASTAAACNFAHISRGADDPRRPWADRGQGKPRATVDLQAAGSIFPMWRSSKKAEEVDGGKYRTCCGQWCRSQDREYPTPELRRPLSWRESDCATSRFPPRTEPCTIGRHDHTAPATVWVSQRKARHCPPCPKCAL